MCYNYNVVEKYTEAEVIKMKKHRYRLGVILVAIIIVWGIVLFMYLNWFPHKSVAKDEVGMIPHMVLIASSYYELITLKIFY